MPDILKEITAIREKLFSIHRDPSFVHLLRTTVLVLVLYYVLRQGGFKIATLTSESYTHPIILIELLKKGFKYWYFFIPIFVGFLLLYKRAFRGWHTFENGLYLRNFIIIISAILAWMYCFYTYNFFHDQAHLLDRGLVILFLILTFRFPVFIIPFSLQVLIIIGQFEVLNGYSLAVPLFPLHIIFLFISFYVFMLLGGRFKFVHFIFLLGCILATEYMGSGIGKVLKTGWLLENQIEYLIPNSFGNGWLRFLDTDALNTLTSTASKFNLPLKILTLTLELGVIFFFLKRKWSKILLLGIICLHLGIFLFSGIFFWAWMLLDLIFIFMILNKGVFIERLLFNKKALVLSIFVILSGYFWNNSVKLVWLDVPLSYTYTFYAETENKTMHKLSQDFFKPFDYQFKIGNFNHLDKQKRLAVNSGITSNIKTVRLFNTPKSEQEIIDLERTTGTVAYQEKEANKTISFIQEFIKNRNSKPEKPLKWFRYIDPPDLLWTEHNEMNHSDRIAKIYIVKNTNYYTASKGYRVIKRDTIQEFNIPSN